MEFKCFIFVLFALGDEELAFLILFFEFHISHPDRRLVTIPGQMYTIQYCQNCSNTFVA